MNGLASGSIEADAGALGSGGAGGSREGRWAGDSLGTVSASARVRARNDITTDTRETPEVGVGRTVVVSLSTRATVVGVSEGEGLSTDEVQSVTGSSLVASSTVEHVEGLGGSWSERGGSSDVGELNEEGRSVIRGTRVVGRSGRRATADAEENAAWEIAVDIVTSEAVVVSARNISGGSDVDINTL